MYYVQTCCPPKYTLRTNYGGYYLTHSIRWAKKNIDSVKLFGRFDEFYVLIYTFFNAHTLHHQINKKVERNVDTPHETSITNSYL